ncbi:hypothetical protein HZ326_3524 [Fusarium oxysporum f. sp. albedinis]|nr:hypothetical protein HZ326_3524 [Fusarium oxysporum f. sp. albedinis]
MQDSLTKLTFYPNQKLIRRLNLSVDDAKMAGRNNTKSWHRLVLTTHVVAPTINKHGRDKIYKEVRGGSQVREGNDRFEQVAEELL